MKKKLLISILAVSFFCFGYLAHAAKIGDDQKCGELGESTKCAETCESGYATTSGTSAGKYLVCGKNQTTVGLQYKLLESVPGFYSRGSAMSDLPGLILAIYKFGIWTVGIAGLFMIVIGGIMYAGSAGNTSVANTAKGVITDALIGIIAAMGAYLFLYVINPDLTGISVDFAEKIELEGAEDEEVRGTMSGSLVARNGYKVDSSFTAALEKIQREKGIRAAVTSGLRSLQKQKDLIVQNCGGNPPTRTCSPSTCLLRNGPSSCPHTTGRAADIWALDGNGRQAISQSQCMSNVGACFNNTYQKALIAAMKAEGFCVLSTEPWHFEKPKMSSKCVY